MLLNEGNHFPGLEFKEHTNAASIIIIIPPGYQPADMDRNPMGKDV